MKLHIEYKPEMVNSRFQLINFIVEDRIARPKKLRMMFDSPPQGARGSVAKRGG